MSVYFNPLPPLSTALQLRERLNLGASVQVNRDSSSGDAYEPPLLLQEQQSSASQTEQGFDGGQDLLQDSQRAVRALSHVIRNANDAIAMLQIAEDAFVKLSPSLGRMRALFLLALEGTLYPDEQTELYQQTQYVEYVVSAAQFRQIPLFGATGQRNTLFLQLGESPSEQFRISFELSDLRPMSFDMTSYEGIQSGIDRCQQALQIMTRDRERFAALRGSIYSIILRLLAGRSSVHFVHTPLNNLATVSYTIEETRGFLLRHRGTALITQTHNLALITDDLTS